jgi:hypothetical protein
MGERRRVYRAFVGKSEGNRPLGRPRSRCKDIKMDLQEVEFGSMIWIEWAEERGSGRTLVNAAMNLWAP